MRGRGAAAQAVDVLRSPDPFNVASSTVRTAVAPGTKFGGGGRALNG